MFTTATGELVDEELHSIDETVARLATFPSPSLSTVPSSASSSWLYNLADTIVARGWQTNSQWRTYCCPWYVNILLTCPQPFSLRAAALFIGTGLALIAYFQYEKARLERKRIVEMSKGYGKPKVGGPFTLQDLEGKEFTEKELLGKYSIVGFGHSLQDIKDADKM